MKILLSDFSFSHFFTLTDLPLNVKNTSRKVHFWLRNAAIIKMKENP